ncbi:MAG: 30S ribosomal protein S8 [Candidatus Methylomirabilales bacterium]
MLTDPIADMLTRLRNANQAGHDKVDIPRSKVKVEIARILRDEGFIRNFEVMEDSKQGVLRIYLKFGPQNERVIRGITRVSRPGLKVYAGAAKIPRVMSGIGTAVLSTSRGIMTDREARAEAIGGEVLCYVW